MSISSVTNRSTPALTNGVTTVFAFTYLIQVATHLKVYKTDVTTRVATLLVKDTDYTVTFTAGVAGGSITMLSILATGYEILILRRVPFTQDVDIANDTGWYPSVHENAFDYLTMEIQDLKDRLDHAFIIPLTEPGTDGGQVISNFTGTTVTGITGATGATGAVPNDWSGAKIYNFLNDVVTVSTTTVTLSQASHGGRLVRFTHASGCTVTIPSTLPEGFSMGWTAQGAAQVTFAAGAGATLRNSSSHTKSRALYSTGVLACWAIGVATLGGDTAA